MTKHLAILAAALLTVPTARGDLVFQIVTVDGQATATVRSGDTLALRTRFVADAGDAVGGVVYNLTLFDGIELLARDYDSHGWFQDDGTFDLGAPISSALPAITTPALYLPTPEADIYFSTARADLADLPPAATHVLEDLTLRVPLTAAGSYTFAFNHLEAGTILGGGVPIAAPESFRLTVLPVPEPSSVVLLVLAAFPLLSRRR